MDKDSLATIAAKIRALGIQGQGQHDPNRLCYHACRCLQAAIPLGALPGIEYATVRDSLTPECYPQPTKPTPTHMLLFAMRELAKLGKVPIRDWHLPDTVVWNPEYVQSNFPVLADLVEGFATHGTDQKDDTAHDTVDDTAKKTKKKPRVLNDQARKCIKVYQGLHRAGKNPSMETIVQEHVEKHGGSATGIMRRLNDNPDEWKSVSQKPT